MLFRASPSGIAGFSSKRRTEFLVGYKKTADNMQDGTILDISLLKAVITLLGGWLQ